MSLAESDAKFLIQAEKMLIKKGGSAIWNDIVLGTRDSFGNIVTPDTSTPYNISLFTIDAKEGWINSGLANVSDTVFMVSAKQLKDYGVTFDKNETITFNSKVYTIARDIPDMGGQEPILHNFVCTITS